MRKKFEYLVLGYGSVEVRSEAGSRSMSLYNDAHNAGIVVIQTYQDILNALGKDGWEVVTLDYPFVFKRETI